MYAEKRTGVMRDKRTRDLKDYLDFFRRRRTQILIPMGAILFVTACVAFLLPPAYRSSATILIEEQEVPPDLVRSTVTSYADQRIETIKHQVMTRSNLWRIVEQYDLYPGMRDRKTVEEVLDKLVDDIEVSVISADVVDRRTGHSTRATIAFTLSYLGETPQVSQKVAGELTNLFLAENLKSRERNAQETTAFLGREAGNLDGHIKTLERRIAAFKERAGGALPELVQLNMQLMDQARRELLATDREIHTLEENKIYLEGQLATMRPDTPMITTGGERILDAGERLKALRAQYAASAAVLLPEHPDRIKMKQEIEALEKETGNAVDPGEIHKKFLNERTRLSALIEEYGPDHPDVIRSRKTIESLEEEVRRIDREPVKMGTRPPENPTYIMTQSQLASTQNSLEALKSTREALREQVRQYAERIEKTPALEQVYQDLTRDRDNSVQKYHEIRSNLLEAQVSEGMETQQKGERFSLIDPPALPEKPEKPNRAAILFLGTVLGAAGGIGCGAALEGMDRSIRTTQDLLRLTHAPPLAVIPYRPNAEDERRKAEGRKRWIYGAAALVLAFFVLVHFFYLPLDVAWFYLWRRFGF